MKKKFFILLAISSLITIFSACHNQTKKDADIKEAVKKTLKDDPAATNVTADVKDGVVTLSGTCLNDQLKEQCTRRIETVPEVKSVVNNCTVLHETVMTDDELNRQLYDLTKDLSTINSIKIEAMDGIVQIAGPVTRIEWDILKAAIDKLKPKGYDTTLLNVR